jgi:hypothetical protein
VKSFIIFVISVPPFHYHSGSVIIQYENCGYNLMAMEFSPDMIIELEKAQAARSSGNEGMARVCARRAAGIAARTFLVIHGDPSRHLNSVEALLKLALLPELPHPLKDAAANLSLRVDQEFKLPVDVDLILEAKKLIGGLS